jgi:hypothetical protein
MSAPHGILPTGQTLKDQYNEASAEDRRQFCKDANDAALCNRSVTRSQLGVMVVGSLVLVGVALFLGYTLGQRHHMHSGAEKRED